MQVKLTISRDPNHRKGLREGGLYHVPEQGETVWMSPETARTIGDGGWVVLSRGKGGCTAPSSPDMVAEQLLVAAEIKREEEEVAATCNSLVAASRRRSAGGRLPTPVREVVAGGGDLFGMGME